MTVVARTGANILLTMTNAYISRPGQLATGDKQMAGLQFTLTTAEDDITNLTVEG